MQTKRYQVMLRCAEFGVLVECYVCAASVDAARELASQCAMDKGLSCVEVVSVGLDERVALAA